MIRPGFILGIARAEARLTRRLVRFWVFASLAMLIGLGAYLQLYFLHRFISHLSASAAALNPRYFVSNFGNNSSAVCHLSAAFFSKHLITSSASAGGTDSRYFVTGSGICVTCAASNSCCVLPTNGVLPVSNS